MKEDTLAVAETTPAMLWLGDQEGRSLFLSSALRQFWGVNPKELKEFEWSSTLHPDDVELLNGPLRQAMATETAFSVEARY